ncbi:hypothetical protein CEXT_707461 [Caerostris extrusa]|uniref:Uncharacterized protein n=1 Tax=Caerostris extrusa TaxID=172846 RepID=A0AAV4Y953_CAEEX|nr:hypothetical protein CEXT_707461 [Caerostris extrusa]
MPTPVPWPAALDYAVEDPWREQPDQDGPTDSRLGLNPGVCWPGGTLKTRHFLKSSIRTFPLKLTPERSPNRNSDFTIAKSLHFPIRIALRTSKNNNFSRIRRNSYRQFRLPKISFHFSDM